MSFSIISSLTFPKTILLTIVLITLKLSSSQDNIDTSFYCTDEFCQEKTRLEPCPVTRTCRTIGFRTFLDPSECNCCPYCFDYLNETDTCSPSSTQKPTEMCGPHLECVDSGSDSEPAVCKTITTGPKSNTQPIDPNFCMTRRQEYLEMEEDGQLGIVQYRPECDAGGYYAPRQCIPGSLCYCSDENGQRIFGQALISDRQDCACSRDVNRLIGTFGLTPGRLPHCLPNGDYDELQCVVRSCFCRSFPANVVNSRDMNRLPCFNESIHTYDRVTPLYYMRACELERAKAEIDIAEAALEGITLVIADVPSCAPDGNYAAVQTRFDKKFCADPESGEVLEDFVVGKFSKAGDDMNCYCALARHLVRSSATARPQCCPNGNYRPLQRIGGNTFFCVDSYGRQNISDTPHEVHSELEVERLVCMRGIDIGGGGDGWGCGAE